MIITISVGMEPRKRRTKRVVTITSIVMATAITTVTHPTAPIVKERANHRLIVMAMAHMRTDQNLKIPSPLRKGRGTGEGLLLQKPFSMIGA
jgi:hypothetical protein